MIKPDGKSASGNLMVGVIPMLQTWYDGGVVTSSTAVTRPSETILLAGSYYHNNIFGGGDLLSNVGGWDYTGPQAIPDGRVTGGRDGSPYTITENGKTVTINKNNRDGGVATVYQGNGLFVFTDTHAKAMKPQATNPNENDQDSTLDSQNMWNAKRS